ncbi:MAG TPA: c-type cytochrome [Burkholderiales bacterium]|nr:c-type cytochrome [Burkholderiales bacterium]
MIRAAALAASLAIASTIAGQAMAQTKSGAAKSDADKAQAIASQVCAACHGNDGNSTAPANPKLAGQFSEYLYKQLADFKAQDGKKPARVSAVMNGMVANLSEAQMKSLAGYYAGQKLNPALATDKDLALLGQKLWRGGNPESGVPACAGCHGPSGAGIPIQYPRLSGQFAEYMVAQLRLFRDGERANDPGGMMRGVAARMSEQEMRAVAEYAAGLR